MKTSESMEWTMKRGRVFAVALLMGASITCGASDKVYPKSKVSYADFKALVAEVEAHRAKRLIDLDTFLKMSQKDGVVILDARSKMRYDRVHVKGAKHLNYSDFTQSDLLKLIPDPNTTILIYCNNNFRGNQVDFRSKIAMPAPRPLDAASDQLLSEERPVMMALNVPAFINLYGYGYRNVYELDELVSVDDPRITFEGSTVGKISLVPKRIPTGKIEAPRK